MMPKDHTETFPALRNDFGMYLALHPFEFYWLLHWSGPKLTIEVPRGTESRAITLWTIKTSIIMFKHVLGMIFQDKNAPNRFALQHPHQNACGDSPGSSGVCAASSSAGSVSTSIRAFDVGDTQKISMANGRLLARDSESEKEGIKREHRVLVHTTAYREQPLR